MHLHLVEHVRALRGGSQPRLMRASDGHLYIVKLQDNPQGSRVLANELLASRLAQLAGLPVPQAEILELSPKLAGTLHFETPTGRRRIYPGLQVGSRLVISPIEGRIYDFLPRARARFATKSISRVFGCLICGRATGTRGRPCTGSDPSRRSSP